MLIDADLNELCDGDGPRREHHQTIPRQLAVVPSAVVVISPLTCAVREVVGLVAGRWDAWFEDDHLVVRRRRLLPWLKADVRWIPLATIVDIRPLSAADHAKRRAQLTVQDPSSPHLTDALSVRFTPEQWQRAGGLVQERQLVTAEPPQPGEKARSDSIASRRPTVPPQSRRWVPQTRRRSSTRPSEKRASPATPVMRAGDGKRPVWLWLEDGDIHASLVPVGNTSPRKLSPSDVAHLLLAEPARAVPAIRALTGIADSEQALVRLRSWERVVVNLGASDLAGRRVTEALQKPGRSNPDGSVRTVSGGLPTLNKRRR
ncbi:hypothetical protein Q2K19_25620 [Micromonospora soli]|uniref:hypothetical protein n=1 Tax=Micromonospora sp. NBRC 110009 TaxID=3061627 RepID=UPI002670D908|nr:hypothetical protein [Micromonospora sp. NBRC 110009]WKT97529.1 hypothetical protein Q2K19_25620 [Micromonospora sp. NBRC 110009]